MNEVLGQEKKAAKSGGWKKGEKNKLQVSLVISVVVLFLMVMALGWYIFDVQKGKIEEFVNLWKDNFIEVIEPSFLPPNYKKFITNNI